MTNSDKIKRVKELSSILAEHSYRYYALDNPSISDFEYDKLYDELSLLEKETGFCLPGSPTQKVQGTVLDCFTKVTHSKPMLSADKTKDHNVIKKFVFNKDFYCSYKLDGLTLVVYYENGHFIRAVTRGNGEIGEDVTEQAKMISNLPMNINYAHPLELRGECVIAKETFSKINETLETPYSHARNLAAGSLRQLDTSITKSRHLSFICFECVSNLYDEDDLFDSKWDELDYLDYLGFETVERYIGAVDDCINEMKPELYKYPCDGLIFEYCDKKLSASIPATSHHEGCRMALKWQDDKYTTILRDVEWNTSKSGTVSPVAVFDEVDLDGAITSRATLHNVSIIKQLKLGIGDEISVIRANMVIPKVVENLTQSDTLELPTICPTCGCALEHRNSDTSEILYCPNEHCGARLSESLKHFVSRNALNIEGLSEATLNFIIDKGWVRNFVDLYHLDEYKDEWSISKGFGVASVNKIFASIEKSRNVKLENFIYALGISGIGRVAAKTITKYFKTFDNWYTNAVAKPFPYETLDDFGETTAEVLKNYCRENQLVIFEIADEMKFIEEENNISTEAADNSLKGLNICITGKLTEFENRDKLILDIESRGGKFVGAVNSKCNYLINNDSASPSSKNKKAHELNVPIITEKEYLNLIQYQEAINL